MDTRTLTGKWYLKKRLFGFVVMVQIIETVNCYYDFSESPEFIKWEKASETDLIDLGIKCV